MLLADYSKQSRLELLDPPGREPVVRPMGLLEVDPRAAVRAVGLHELQEVGLGLPVRRLKPLTLDLYAEKTGVVSLLTWPRPIQTKSGCLINCRIRKALNSSISDKWISREVVLLLKLLEERSQFERAVSAALLEREVHRVGATGVPTTRHSN